MITIHLFSFENVNSKNQIFWYGVDKRLCDYI